MINPSSAPKSPNPMPAGLGALTQMGPTPKGKSPSNMGQVMALARKMSDMQLADVLQGKSLAVPQFAAMTEAMGRKSLRNAMQGAEAQMQAKQPSVKDKLLAEEAAQQLPEASGIGQIPAPNMESMGMAGGGIIAFDDGGEVPRFNGAAQSLINVPSSSEFDQDVAISRFDSPAVAKEKRERALRREQSIKEQQLLNAQQAKIQGGNSKNIAEPVSVNPDDPFSMAANAPRPLVGEPPAPPSGGAVPNAAPRPSAGGGGGTPPPAGSTIDQDIAAYTEKYKGIFGETPKFLKRDNPFYNTKYEGDDPSKVRDQGMGYGFMKAAQALLTNPTMSGGMGAAIGAFGEAGFLTAKEIKAAKKDERDYNMNIAKATELFEQGQEEKAIKYQTLAQDKEDKIRNLALNTVKAGTDKFSAEETAKYQKMMANKPPEGLALLNALGNPELMARYKEMQTAKKPNTISYETSLKEYNDKIAADPRFEKRFPTPQSYYNYVQQSSAVNQPRFLGFE
jgi:hypothetical protein